MLQTVKISYGSESTKLLVTEYTPRGVLRISSDGDDWMEPEVKTQKNP